MFHGGGPHESTKVRAGSQSSIDHLAALCVLGDRKRGAEVDDRDCKCLDRTEIRGERGVSARPLLSLNEGRAPK